MTNSAAYSTQSLTEQGYAAAKRSQFEDAVALFRRALQIDPSLAECRYHLARVLMVMGQQQNETSFFTEALGLLEHLCEEYPADTTYLLQKAKVYGLLNRPDEALDIFANFKGSDAEMAEAGHWLEQMRRMREDQRNAPQGMEQVYALYTKANSEPTAENIAGAQYYIEEMLYTGEYKADLLLLLVRLAILEVNDRKAEQYLRDLGELVPDSAEYHFEWARVLDIRQQFVSAIASCEKAIACKEDYAPAWFELALLQERVNNLEAAEKAKTTYGVLVGEDDPHWRTLESIIATRQGRYDDARQVLESMQEEIADNHIMLSTLAICYENLSEYAKAHEFYVRAGKIAAASPVAQHYQRGAAEEKRNEEHYEGYNSERIERWLSVAQGVQDEIQDPVFLVGLPRSGTTLVEQILSVHGATVVSDEFPALSATLSQIRFDAEQTEQATIPEILDKLSAKGVAAYRQYYCNVMAAQIEGYDPNNKSMRLIDKNPINIRLLGALQRLFPKAKVIVMLRDPRDVVVSCFTHTFIHGNLLQHTTTLDDAADYYDYYMKSYLHFKEHLHLSMLEIRYEDVVADVEQSARKLLEFIGLTWDENVLRYYEKDNQRQVATPSYGQVVKPIYQSSLQRWKPYEPYMQKALQVLQPYTKRFNYDGGGSYA